MEETGKKASTKTTAPAEPKVSFVKKVKNFCKGVKAEFKKIIWPNKEDLQKKTIAVVVVSVVLGSFIRVYDFACQFVIGLMK